MAESLKAMAAKMGMTVSEMADATPWDPASVASYAAKHGNRNDPLGYQHLPDVQIAGCVRMLMRNDLDHESVVVAARDRICALHIEKAELLAVCKAMIDAATTRTPEIERMIAVVSKAERR